jgi:hypothetical protein
MKMNMKERRGLHCSRATVKIENNLSEQERTQFQSQLPLTTDFTNHPNVKHTLLTVRNDPKQENRKYF